MNKSYLSKTTFIVTLFFLVTIVSWFIIDRVRSIFTESIIIAHSLIILTLFFSTCINIFLITLYKKEKLNIVEVLGLKLPNIKQSDSRYGYRILLIYFISTMLICYATNIENFQYIAQKALLQPFVSINMFLSVFIVPLYEEIYFRGCIQESMKHLLSPKKHEKFHDFFLIKPEILITALIFSLFHAPFSPTIWASSLSSGNIPLPTGPLFLGIICGIIRSHDNSIVFAILFHAAANLLGNVWYYILPEQILPLFYINSQN